MKEGIMKVPLLDLKKQYQTIRDAVLAVTTEIYENQYFILGPHVEALEKDIAAYCTTAHAVGVSSGTDALLISLMAAGIGPEDRVITSPYTFFATAGSIARVGAVPLFVDIDPETYNMAPENLEALLAGLPPDQRRRVRAIIPVHLYGQCADMSAVLQIAGENGWDVIEDAAQAIGAEYRQRRAGSMGAFGCFSFFPSKNLGAFGDGGIVTTNDGELAHKLRMFRGHGMEPKYYHAYVGGNFRLDALQAAVVRIKLKYLDGWTDARRSNADRYRELFAEAGLDEFVRLPVDRGDRHIYNQFVISVAENRDKLRQFLTEAEIGTEIYYPLPLHLQQCFSHLGYKQHDFPNAERAAAQTLALPIYPELTEEQQTYVVKKIREFYMK